MKAHRYCIFAVAILATGCTKQEVTTNVFITGPGSAPQPTVAPSKTPKPPSGGGGGSGGGNASPTPEATPKPTPTSGCPAIDFDRLDAPVEVLPVGSTATLHYETSGANECTISSDAGWAFAGQPPGGDFVTPALAANQTITFFCISNCGASLGVETNIFVQQ